MKLNRSVPHVFTSDGYGGIDMLELDWKQDAVWIQGNLEDDCDTINECFKRSIYRWYPTLLDCALGNENYFTDIEA